MQGFALSLVLLLTITGCKTLNPNYSGTKTQIINYAEVPPCMVRPEAGVTFPANEKVAALLKQLDSDNFAQREAAEKDLQKLLATENEDGKIRYFIEAGLSSRLSLEVESRLKHVLAECIYFAYKGKIPDCVPKGSQNYDESLVDVRPTDGHLSIAVELGEIKPIPTGSSSSTCAEALDVAKVRFEEFRKTFERKKVNVAPFQPIMDPNPDTYLSLANCCRLSSGFVSMAPAAWSYNGVYVDPVKSSVEGFKNLCASRGGEYHESLESSHSIDGEGPEAGQMLYIGGMRRVETDEPKASTEERRSNYLYVACSTKGAKVRTGGE